MKLENGDTPRNTHKEYAGVHVNDPFLQKVRVASEAEAMRNSIRAALQHNPVYRSGVSNKIRKEIRRDWADEILRCISTYDSPVSEEKHIDHIESISGAISKKHSHSLRGGRLRIGTSQKALNLYLKFLWRLGRIICPPHCPIDRIILGKAGLVGSWTSSDSIDEYKRWIGLLKKKALPQSIAEWEYDSWLND